MACRLFPLSVSFDLGEIVDGEVPMSKLALPSQNFLGCQISRGDG
jgi:hypothetical protein